MLSPLPKISIVMNCLNSERYLREALDSIYAQTYTNWEIIFWDNASSDGSASIAKSYSSKLKYFRGEETIPLGAARNKALEKADGELIAFLDCDDLWLPEKLSEQIKLFSDPQVGLVYSDTIFFNETGHEQRFHKRHRPCRGFCFLELLTDYCISLEAAIIRKSALTSLLEWFDPRFNLIEEADLFYRIAHDWKIDYVNFPLSKWRVHPESWSWKKTEHFVDELELLFEKYRSLYPEFQKTNSPEADLLQRQISFQKAKKLWIKRQGKEARDQLRSIATKTKATKLLYMATFFNQKWVYRVANLLKFSVLP